MSNLFVFGFDEAHKAEEVRLKLLCSSDDRGMPPTYDSMPFLGHFSRDKRS